jgi:glycosyltransferase involved in cell wall biosynthesis
LKIVHLTSSRFFGGPERQMLGLAQALPDEYETVFVSFSEEGLCEEFLNKVRNQGFSAFSLKNDMPHLIAAFRELKALLRQIQADILCCHGYKANLLGRFVSRQIGIPAIAVSRGWTGESYKVKAYEALDKWNLRRMDHVVCVSNAQAEKVQTIGVSENDISVICNAIQPERFEHPDPSFRNRLESLFQTTPRHIVGAAGRLSPEKGFEVLIAAASQIVREDPTVGFVLFGDGSLRQQLQNQIQNCGLDQHFILAGFNNDLDRWMPHLDLFVLPSFTEGLPNVILEAFAAKVPVVATSVGGTPEVVDDGINGYLVPPGNPEALSNAIHNVMRSEKVRKSMATLGFQKVTEQFNFKYQAERYQILFDDILSASNCRMATVES